MEIDEAKTIITETEAARTVGEREYKINDAITDAQYYRAHPEVIVDARHAKRVIDTLLSGLEVSPCYFKAVRLGIPSFTFLAYDRGAHDAILGWSYLAEINGARPEKYESARALVAEWEKRTDLRWPT
jgi:hypothetical protein